MTSYNKPKSSPASPQSNVVDLGGLPPRAARGDTLSAQPLYVQIKERLRGQILDGTYQPHQQLPSEAEMIAALKVSRITVRQALSDLENEGMIFRVHGKGSFVSKPKAFQDLGRLQGFGEAMRSKGYETFARVISMRNVAPSAHVREQLALGKRAQVTELRRLRFLNREPISLDVSYLPVALGQKLARQDLATRDVFAILEDDFGLQLGHADLQIGAALADAALGAQLQVPEGSSVLCIQRLTHTADGAPVDFENLFYRGDAFQYRVRVDRGPL